MCVYLQIMQMYMLWCHIHKLNNVMVTSTLLCKTFSSLIMSPCSYIYNSMHHGPSSQSIAAGCSCIICLEPGQAAPQLSPYTICANQLSTPFPMQYCTVIATVIRPRSDSLLSLSLIDQFHSSSSFVIVTNVLRIRHRLHPITLT